jgi:hypothetical protein
VWKIAAIVKDVDMLHSFTEEALLEHVFPQWSSSYWWWSTLSFLDYRFDHRLDHCFDHCFAHLYDPYLDHWFADQRPGLHALQP